MSQMFLNTWTFSIVASTVFAATIAIGYHWISQKEKKQTLWVDPSKPFFKLTYTDAYKGEHSKMLATVSKNPIQNVQCYFSSRLGSKGDEESVVFVGLQVILETLKNTRITKEEVDRLETLYKRGPGLGSFNREPWDFVVEECGGILPIEIFALPEGTLVPRGVPLFKIQSTRPEFAPAVGYLEPLLSQVWFPLTVATKCHELKKSFDDYVEKTGANPEHSLFMLQDFGVRGTSSMQSADAGGLAHLSIFRGTDNLPAIDAVDTFYEMENSVEESPGCSVNATEHSVMTINGPEGEYVGLQKLLDMYPDGILSIVIDSFNQPEFVDVITGPRFSDIIMKRKGKIVLRPDSGVSTDVLRMILQTFRKNLNSYMTKNEKGFLVLPPGYGIIFGDGLDKYKMIELLEIMLEEGFSVENIIFGAGGALLQKGLDEHGLNRDTFRCSFKLCAYQDLDETWHQVFKDPSAAKSVKGESKASLKGRQKVIFCKKENRLISVCEDDCSLEHSDFPDEMRLVYREGELFNRMSFDEVRRNIQKV